MTEERKQKFLEALAESGSACAAARAATPHPTGRRGGYSSFQALAARDPEFAAAVVEARSRALGKVEDAIMRRAVEGVRRPVYQGGVLVGHERVYSDPLLLRLAARLDPAWAERQRVEQTHSCALLLEPADVELLNDGDAEMLTRLLGVIAERRAHEESQRRVQGLPGPDTTQP